MLAPLLSKKIKAIRSVTEYLNKILRMYCRKYLTDCIKGWCSTSKQKTRMSLHHSNHLHEPLLQKVASIIEDPHHYALTLLSLLLLNRSNRSRKSHIVSFMTSFCRTNLHNPFFLIVLAPIFMV